MSALFAIAKEKFAVFSHDTLSHLPWQEGHTDLVPMNYATKSVSLPQFKTILGAVGTNNLLGEAFNLIQMSIVGSDIRCVLKLDGGYVKEYLLTKNCSGTLVVCGYNDAENTFKVFAIDIKSDKEPEWLDCQVLLLPPFTKAANTISMLNDPLNEVAGKAIDIIKEIDDQFPINERAGIGGQVVVNLLQLDKKGDIIIDNFIHHSYPDYEALGEKMMERLKNR